jgi:integrase
VYLLLLTGQRKSDVLKMRWSEVSLRDGRWSVPASTKTGKPFDVSLVPTAVAILQGRKHTSQWVFPSASAGSGHIRDLKSSYWKLLRAADIVNLTQHDLRRTFATRLNAMGITQATIQSALGHASGSNATARYVRPSLPVVAAAAARNEQAILGLLKQSNRS